MNTKMTKYETYMCELSDIPIREYEIDKPSHPELRYMCFQNYAEYKQYLTEDYGSSETESRRYLYQALKIKLMGLFYDDEFQDYFSGCSIDTYKMLLMANIPTVKAWATRALTIQ